MRNSLLRCSALLGVILLISACGGGSADLSPEIVAHLDKYERLIDEFEPRFAAVRNNPPEFARVAESYQQAAQAWISEWDTVAPDLSDEEGRAIKAQVDELNRRATRMLTGT